MRTRRIEMTSWAAGIGLALAMPLSAVAQQPQGLHYTPPASQGLMFTPLAPLPPLKPVSPDGQATVVEGIVARVNDKVITQSDIEKDRQQILADLQANRMTAAEAEQRQKDLLRDLIDAQLLLSRGAELNINVDADVIKQLDAMRKQYGLDSMEALEKAAAQEGVSFQDYKDNIKNQLITQQVIREEVMRHLPQPSQEEMQAYYQAHLSEYQQPEQVGLSEILIPTEATATDAEVAQAKAKADQVEAELKAGANFADEVKKDSSGPTASQGGELGVYKRGVLGPVYDDATFVLPVGGVTAPIRTRQGFVILKVTQHIAAGAQPFKEAMDQVYSEMMQAEMAPALRTYLTSLRNDAFIDLANGYTDTGRSPNETKVGFAAATPPPAPKVKKKMTAQRFDRAASTHNANAVPALPPASTNGKLIASSTKPGKRPKKIKREKVRFGQAPRNSLTPGDAVVEASPSAQGPGAAATLQQDAPQVADTSTDVNPLLPQATTEKKTRFAKSEPVHGPKKPKKLNAKQKEKLSATPIPLTADEKKQQQVQAEALGVNGDNLSKKKKVKQKKVKGQKKAPEPAKPRIQERPAPTGPVQPAPTVNPNLGAPIPGQVPATSGASSSTTTPASK